MNKYLIWSYWFLTATFLAISLFINAKAIYVAMAINFIHAAHFYIKSPSITSFSMQVRIGFLGLLAIGMMPSFQWIHWIQLIGGSIMLTTGYCPLARMLSLLPWNRNQPISFRLLKIVIFTPPISGNFNNLLNNK